MKKIVSMILVAVMLCTMFVACAKDKAPTITAKVTVEIKADDTTVLEKTEVQVDGIDGAAPVAFDAICIALDEEEIDRDFDQYTIGSNVAQFFNTIGDYDTEDGKYVWDLYINGTDDKDRVDTGLSVTEIMDGDSLILIRNLSDEEGDEEADVTTADTTAAE